VLSKDQKIDPLNTLRMLEESTNKRFEDNEPTKVLKDDIVCMWKKEEEEEEVKKRRRDDWFLLYLSKKNAVSFHHFHSFLLFCYNIFKERKDFHIDIKLTYLLLLLFSPLFPSRQNCDDFFLFGLGRGIIFNSVRSFYTTNNT
jgi:hypothetical protein